MKQTRLQANTGQTTGNERGFRGRGPDSRAQVTPDADAAILLMRMRSMNEMRENVIRIRWVSELTGKLEAVDPHFEKWMEIFNGLCKAEESLDNDIINRRSRYIKDVETKFGSLLSNPGYVKTANRRLGVIGLADSIKFMATSTEQHVQLLKLEMRMMRAFCGLADKPGLSLSEFSLWQREYLASAESYLKAL